MPRLRTVWIFGALATAFPVIGNAQAKPAPVPTPNLAPPPGPAVAPAAAPASPTPDPATEVGVPAIDYFTFSTFAMSVPLRHDGVVAGSEKVELDGKPLQVGQDFWLDRDTCRVYFRTIPQTGQAVMISYRYDPMLAKKGVTGFSEDVGFGNRIFMTYGNGGAEGFGTGSTFGFSSNVGVTGTGFTGMALFTNRGQSSQLGQSDGPQSLNSALGGGGDKLVFETLHAGALKLSYQDVSEGFNDFNSAADSGADAATMQQLIKERGLKRLGFNIDDLKFGQGSISESFKQVSDGDDSIDWRSLGIKEKNFSVNWTSRTVNNGFWRFDDLAEADKDQLRSEAGLSRENVDGAMKLKGGTLSYKESDVSQTDGNGIHTQSLNYAGLYTIKFGRQSVDAGFDRFASLPDAERNAFQNQAGMDRDWADLGGPIGKSKFTFDKTDVGSLNGMLRMTDFTLGSALYSFRHYERDVAQGFNSFGNMSVDDLNMATDGIGKLFNPGYQDNPGDRSGFQRGPGLDRDGTRLDLTPGKWKASFATLKIDNGTDGALYDAMNLSAGRFVASVTRTSVDQNFNLGSVMDFEHNLLGTLQGLERTDVTAHYDALKGRTIDLQAMRASTSTGGASRTAFVLKDPRLELDLSARKVDAGFTNVGQMKDSESAWLNQLMGDGEQEAKLKYQPNSKLHIEAWLANASGGPNDDTQGARDFSVNWSPNAKTTLEIQQTDHTHNSSLGPILDQKFDHVAFRRDFGQYGKLAFVEERVVTEGTLKTGPDSVKQDLTYETKVSKNAGLSLEETKTAYDDGTTETVSTQTISQKLTPKSGVSYSSTTITGNAVGQTNQHKDAVGGWVELKGGLKVEYGSGRNLVDDTPNSGTKNTTLNVTQGALGDINFGGNYTENRFDGQHTASQGKVAVSTIKPLRFGRLSDLKFTIGSDTAADWSNYSRDNRQFGLSGKWGSSAFGADYRSALDPASNELGIDRSFNFSTDPGQNAKFRGNFAYKLRTLPGDQQAMIRNFSLTARPLPKMEITHQLQTNPELSKPDAVLGSITQQARVDKWTLDYKKSENFVLGGSFDESMYNGNQLSRVAGLTFTMNEAKGSPISLFVGSEAMDTADGRKASARYMLRYDPKPGENQRLSLFLGNVAYIHNFGAPATDGGMTFRVDYSLKL